MDTQVLKVTDLRKQIKEKEIIKGISLEIEAGEILGFLGPNGSGKSTSLRMIVGLSKPSSGQISICGESITQNFVKAMSHVGCIIEGPDLYNYMSGYQNLQMLGAMSQGVSKVDIDEAVELVGMGKRIHDKVEIYSMGMKQRIGLAQALIHRPKLLVLDEPTNGLDPQGIHEFREIVKGLAREKAISVLISSHLISEVELMCDKVSIINEGSIIKNAAIGEIISTGQVFWLVDKPEKAQQLLRDKFQIEAVIQSGQLRAIADVGHLPKINQALIESGLELQYVGAKNRSLEDLFLTLTDHQTVY